MIFCFNRQNLLSVTKVICQQQSLTPLGNSKPKTLTHGEITQSLTPGIYSMHAIFSVPLEIPYPLMFKPC